MKAKLVNESLNEIKRNQEGSGLGAIGVGHIAAIETRVIQTMQDYVKGDKKNLEFTLKFTNPHLIIKLAQHGDENDSSIEFQKDDSMLVLYAAGYNDWFHASPLELEKYFCDNTIDSPCVYYFDAYKLCKYDLLNEVFDLISERYDKVIDDIRDNSDDRDLVTGRLRFY